MIFHREPKRGLKQSAGGVLQKMFIMKTSVFKSAEGLQLYSKEPQT